MPETIPPQCTHLAEQVELLKEELRELQIEQSQASASLKSYYIREVKNLVHQLALGRQQLRACQEQHLPTSSRPDLLAFGVSVILNHAAKRLKVAAIVKNIGKGRAVGPFKIAMSVTEKRVLGSEIISHVQVFQVPAGLIIFPEPVLAPADVAAFNVGGEVGLLTTYVTEEMEVPLRYINENPAFEYEIEFLVDSEQVLNESNESNNLYRGRRWFTNPAGVQRDEPLLIRSSATNGEPNEEDSGDIQIAASVRS